jgi:hypothetical protein
MRLIDADEALEQINEWLDQTGAIPLNTSYHFELLGCIEDCPTIDAVPVVRGEWTTNSDYPDTVICSLCGWKESVWWADKGTNYCPNCGAKMEANQDE